MIPNTRRTPIRLPNPISDDDASHAASRQAWAELAAAIAATPPPPPRAPRVARVRTRRPGLRLTLAATATAAVLIGVTGALSGRDPIGAQAADAAILRGAAAALHPTGAIVLDTFSTVVKYPSGHRLHPGESRGRGQWSGITETPAGIGPQNELVLNMGSSAVRGVQSGYVNGNNELYDPIGNVVYESSNYGPDISASTSPGTYVYTMPHAIWFRLPSVMTPPGSPDMPPPLTITAEQARALRNGSAEVRVNPDSHHHSRMSIHPAFRTPTESTVVHAWLGKLRVVGPTTIDGRRAIKLLRVHGPGEYDVAPGTFYPIREVVQDPSGARTITTWSEYRIVSATPVNERLLSIVARHPGASVDRSRADFLTAYARLTRGA